MSIGQPSVLPAHLKADCSACVGLCCVVPPFDAAQGFGFDKPAETPCQHLCDDFTCGIHTQLVDRGFRGCTVFDCHGAGQRVTQMFPGQDWTQSADTAQRMFAAYSAMRQLHETLALLQTAQVHVADARLQAQVEAIEQLCKHTPVEALQPDQVRRDALALLRSPEISGALRGLSAPR